MLYRRHRYQKRTEHLRARARHIWSRAAPRTYRRFATREERRAARQHVAAGDWWRAYGQEC